MVYPFKKTTMAYTLRYDKLRDLVQLSKVLLQDSEVNPEQLNKIKKLWQQQNELLDGVDQITMQEMILELEVFNTTGIYLGQFIRNLTASTNKFSASEFADRVLQKFGSGGQIDWDALGRAALPVINRAPGLNLMLGTHHMKEPVVMPERRKRTQRAKDPVAQKQQPEKIIAVNKNNDSQEEKVKFILQELKLLYRQNGNTPLNFHVFVIHPTNFTTTVENIFYVSFLIRDALAKLDVIDEELVIAPLNNKEKTDEKKITEIRHQAVLSMSMEEWEEIINEKNITQPTIEWRKHV